MQRLAVSGPYRPVWTVSDLEAYLGGAPSGMRVFLDGPRALRQQMILNGILRETIKCNPHIQVIFRLAADPAAGVITFQSESWSMAHDLATSDAAARLDDIGGVVSAVLAIERIAYVARTGECRGRRVTYNKPVLTIIGAASF